MAHVAPIYPNFARGEVSPLMFGRIDIEQYPTCLDKCRNTYIRPYGCATRLSGTEFIAIAKNNGKARLLKFVFSATDSYIIECGAGYFRFYQDGAPVTSNGLVYEITNDYSEEQLPSIQYVQIDDIIKLTCLPDSRGNSSAKPKELIRNASDNWTFRDVTFKETPYLDQNTTSITMTPSAVTGNDITITASSAYFNSGMVGANMWIGTKVKDDATNKDVQGYVQFIQNNNNSSTVMHAKVISKLSGTTATKLWGEGAFSDYRGYPSVVALYDGRLYYARTPYQPRNVYGSKPYAYETFTPAVDNEDDAGINIQLATNANGDGSDIKWMIGGSYLLCGTYGGEFVIRGTGDGAITATDISARQRTNWGGEPVQPIVAGTFVHFLQRNGNKLRQFQYDFYYDAYKAVDVSIFSEHLLSSPIKEMALQKNPDSIIYLMREDGKVVMLTLEQDQSVQSWSLLEELGAEVESIQTIPSYDGNYDEVYMVMKRQTLETELEVVCSNPNVTVTNNYTGTKETAGQEVITLTYNGNNGVWTTPESTALETSLNVTCSNPDITITNNYNQTKPEVGTITEVLECQNVQYSITNATVNGSYYIDTQSGVINLTSKNSYLQTSSGYGFKIKFSVNSTDRQCLFSLTNGRTYIYAVYEASSIKILNNTGSTIGSTAVTPNTEYWIKNDYGTQTVDISIDDINYTTVATIPWGYGLRYIGKNTYIGARQYYSFKGSLYLAESYCGDQFGNPLNLAEKSAGEWYSQTTGDLVLISGGNYNITISGEINVGDTITCVWTTISGYVQQEETTGGKIRLKEYKITIEGTPADNDTITLTYDTDFTNTVRYIERMLNPITPENQNDWWYVRSGLKYNGFELTEGNNLTLSANQGTVTATASSNIFSENKVGNRIRFIDENYNILGEGTITAYTDETHVTLDITTYFQSQTVTGGKWGISTDTLSGLDHLDGREVQVYADCVEQESKTVIDGSITIDDAFIVVVGLPYTSYITTMPMEAGSQNGTAVGKRKRISEMAIRVWNTIGVKVGRDLNNLYDTIYKQKEPFTGVIPNIKYNQGWVWDANITVEQSHPYPMNILSIAPIVMEVDK